MMDADAVKVHVTNPEDFQIQRTEEHEPEHFNFYTVVVASGVTGYNLFEQVLPEDPLRKDWSILSVDAAVVLASKQQVNDKANQVTGIPYPQGALVPQNASVSGTGTAQLFVVATGATPSRVSVFVNRRSR
jgi:hypothetical protein